MKDIFIDADIANTFADSKDCHIKDLIEWLLNCKSAFLVLTNGLRSEYYGGNEHCCKEFSIRTIVDKLIKDERINTISNENIRKFQVEFFNWSSISSKRKGSKDPEHIAAVLLSDRRFAIVKDDKLFNDLLNFRPKKKLKGKSITVVNCPSKIDYKENEAA